MSGDNVNRKDDVCFVVTDLEESTAMAEADAEAYEVVWTMAA